MDKATLDPDLKVAFEKLPAVVVRPNMTNDWVAYDRFLKHFGSHMVSEVEYGSSLCQHTFSDVSTSYTQKDFKVKACVQLTGPTEAGMLDTKACSDVTQEEIDSVSDITTSSRFVVRGGTAETRAKLINERTDELIRQFMSEADITHEPVTYKFTAIWTMLQTRYLGTDHFPKAMNLEAYYKGYLNYGCSLQTDKTVTLRNFEHSPSSTDDYPVYQCVLPPKGCHSDNDCHYRVGPWCQCKGDTCVFYNTEKLSTGEEKTYATIYRESGWGGQGCKLTASSFWTKCYCIDERTEKQIEWSSDRDSLQFAYWAHDKQNGTLAKCGKGKTPQNRYEL